MESSVQDLTALALEVGSLKASGWMESNSSVLSQIIRAIEVFLTCTQGILSRYTVGFIKNETLVFINFSAQGASILKISVLIIKRRS